MAIDTFPLAIEELERRVDAGAQVNLRAVKDDVGLWWQVQLITPPRIVVTKQGATFLQAVSAALAADA